MLATGDMWSDIEVVQPNNRAVFNLHHLIFKHFMKYSFLQKGFPYVTTMGITH